MALSVQDMQRGRMDSAVEDSEGTMASLMPETQITDRRLSAWADKYRGATVEDLEPPAALSIAPTDSISHALALAFEREYTHLTVINPENRSLLGYLNMERLKKQLASKQVTEHDTVEKAMQKFKRGKKNPYKVITIETPLQELEMFFEGVDAEGKVHEERKQEFAVVTDWERRFVMGVATDEDLKKFLSRRALFTP